jgi:hypothetical protein
MRVEERKTSLFFFFFWTQFSCHLSVNLECPILWVFFPLFYNLENSAIDFEHTWYWNLQSGNKMPTRCNRCFHCRSYCLLNMFQVLLYPSSGAREHYTDGCCLWYLVLGFQVVGMVWSWGLCVRFAGWCCKAGSNHLYNTLELLMMGIMVPETCWASKKIWNENICCI